MSEVFVTADDPRPEGSLSLRDALMWARTVEVVGRPVIIHMANGTYIISILEFFVDDSMRASDIKLRGDGGAELRTSVASQRALSETTSPTLAEALLRIDDGAPPVTLQGLSLRGQVIVSSKKGVAFESCRFEESRAVSGGALIVGGGTVHIESSEFVNNLAEAGGAVLVSAGFLALHRCSLAHNAALNASRGGALLVTGGTVIMMGTLLIGNLAAGVDNSIVLSDPAAEILYELPAPLGRWIPSLGQPKMMLDQGSTGDFPFACAPGLYGSTESLATQSMPECDGLCPPGKMCSAATSEPAICSTGGYCLEGSVSATPCESGTYNGNLGGQDESACRACGEGAYCIRGSSGPTLCPAGFFGHHDRLEDAQCSGLCPAGYYCEEGSKRNNTTPCPAGTFLATEGGARASDCQTCLLGFFCPEASASPSECPTLSRERAAKEGARTLEECSCQIGFYMHAPADCTPSSNLTCVMTQWECKPCPQDTICETANVSLEALDVKPGYWRQDAFSADVRRCHNDACLGGTNVSLQCAEGHQGPYCDVCKPNYHGGANGESCKACEGSTILDYVPAIVLIALLVGLAVFAVHKQDSSAVDRAVDALKDGADGIASKVAERATGAVVPRCTAEDPTLDISLQKHPERLWGFDLDRRSDEGLDFNRVRYVDEDARAAGLRRWDKIIAVDETPVDGPLINAGLLTGKTEVKITVVRPRPTALAKKSSTFQERLDRWSEKMSNSAVKLRILIALWQVLGSLGIVFAIPYPRLYERAVGWISSLVQLNIFGIVPTQCIFPVDFHGKLVLRTLVPLLLMALLIGVGRLSRKIRRSTQLSDRCFITCFYILFLVYPSCCEAIFTFFVCDTLPDGTRFLRVDYSVDCDADEHQGFYAYALGMFLVYPMGTPFVFFLVLRREQERLDKIIRHENAIRLHRQLQSHGTSETRHPRRRARRRSSISQAADVILENSPEWHAAEAERLKDELSPFVARLTDGYEMRCARFEIFECVRKIFLVGIPALFRPGSVGQFVFGMFVCFISFGTYSYWTPYAESDDDRLQAAAQVEIFCALMMWVASDEVTRSHSMALALTVLLFVPPLIALLMETGAVEEGGKLGNWLHKKLVSMCPWLEPNAVVVEAGSTTTSTRDSRSDSVDAQSPTPPRLRMRSAVAPAQVTISPADQGASESEETSPAQTTGLRRSDSALLRSTSTTQSDCEEEGSLSRSLKSDGSDRSSLSGTSAIERARLARSSRGSRSSDGVVSVGRYSESARAARLQRWEGLKSSGKKLEALAAFASRLSTDMEDEGRVREQMMVDGRARDLKLPEDPALQNPACCDAVLSSRSSLGLLSPRRSSRSSGSEKTSNITTPDEPKTPSRRISRQGSFKALREEGSAKWSKVRGAIAALRLQRRTQSSLSGPRRTEDPRSAAIETDSVVLNVDTPAHSGVIQPEVVQRLKERLLREEGIDIDTDTIEATIRQHDGHAGRSFGALKRSLGPVAQGKPGPEKLRGKDPMPPPPSRAMSSQFKWIEGNMEASSSASGGGESRPGPSSESIAHLAEPFRGTASLERVAAPEEEQPRLAPSRRAAAAASKPFQPAELEEHAARAEAHSIASKVVARRRREEQQNKIKEENAEMQLRLKNPPRTKLYEPKAAREPRRSAVGSEEPRRSFSSNAAPQGAGMDRRGDGTQPARVAERIRTPKGGVDQAVAPSPAAAIPRPHSSGDLEVEPAPSPCGAGARRARVDFDHATQSRPTRSAGGAAPRLASTSAWSDAAAQPRRSRVSMDDAHPLAQPTRSRVAFDDADSSDQDETPTATVAPRKSLSKSPHGSPKNAWAPS